MKQTSKGILVLFLTALMSLFWTIGCSKVPADFDTNNENTLATVPQNSISASLQGALLTVEWGGVQQATSYLVTFYNTTLIVNAPTTRAEFTNVEDISDSVTIIIIAQASGYNSSTTTYTFTPTATSSQPTLAMPTGLSVGNNKLTWTAVPNATSYTVSDGTSSVTVSTNSIILASNGLAFPASGSVTYSVVAKASGYNNSAAAVYTYSPTDNQQQSQPTLATPTGLAVSGGRLMWTAVSNATRYTVSDGISTVTVSANNIDIASNGLAFPASGSVTYSVVATASGYNDSKAASYTYSPNGTLPPTPQTLAVPTNLTFNNNKLTWTAVPNATSYTVSDGTTTATVTLNSIDLAAKGFNIPTSGSVTYTVVAKASGYYDSAAASYTYTPTVDPPQPTQKLSTPTNLSVSAGKLTWTAVSKATSYTVSDGTTTATVTVNSIDLAAKGFTIPTSGSVMYTVIAKASGYYDSAAASYTYVPPTPQTLSAPTGIAVSDGVLTWTAVSKATSYTVSDGTTTVTVTTNNIDLAVNGLKVPTNGSVTYTVIAKASGYYDSAAASYKAMPIVATPTGLAVSDGVLTWTAVSNATSYTVSDGSTTVTVTTNSVNLTDSGFIIPASGKATYTVVAKAEGYSDSKAASYTHTFSDTQQQTVAFGEYPQTLKDPSVTVSMIADDDGYYLGSDNARYAKVTATPYLPYTWSGVKFSTGEAVKANTVYYFKVEPIQWRILGTSGNNSLLFCNTIIANGAYCSDLNNREIGGSTVYPSNYMHSDIRSWLNGEFYSTAFSTSQRGSIVTSTVDNSAVTANINTNIYACENTQDNIFLLSNSEVANIAYGFLSYNAESDPARLLFVSDYARATGAYTSDLYSYSGCGWWWLRSPMHDDGVYAYCGTVNGYVGSGSVSSAEGGIAPAMWVATSAL